MESYDEEMRTILIWMLGIAATFNSLADEVRKPEVVRDAGPVIEVVISNGELCRLLETVWKEWPDNGVTSGRNEFFGRLSWFPPGDGEKVDISGDRLLISGHRPFVGVTLYLMSNILMDQSLKVEDFSVLRYPAGNEEGLDKSNEFRKRLRLETAIH